MKMEPVRREKGSEAKREVSIYWNHVINEQGQEETKVGIVRMIKGRMREEVWIAKGRLSQTAKELRILQKELVKEGEIKIRIRSKHIIDTLTLKVDEMEDTNWVGMENKDEWKGVLEILRSKGNRTIFEWVTKENMEDNDFRAAVIGEEQEGGRKRK